MNINIRKCTKEETNIANALLTKLIRDEKQYDDNINENVTVDYYYESVINNENHLILFAEIEEKIVGYIYGFIENYDTTYINKISKLDALYVIEDYRHMGVGKNLIENFIDLSKSKNVSKIEVSACAGNINAMNLYQSINFKPVKITMNLEI